MLPRNCVLSHRKVWHFTHFGAQAAWVAVGSRTSPSPPDQFARLSLCAGPSNGRREFPNGYRGWSFLTLAFHVSSDDHAGSHDTGAHRHGRAARQTQRLRMGITPPTARLRQPSCSRKDPLWQTQSKKQPRGAIAMHWLWDFPHLPGPTPCERVVLRLRPLSRVNHAARWPKGGRSWRRMEQELDLCQDPQAEAGLEHQDRIAGLTLVIHSDAGPGFLFIKLLFTCVIL